MKKPTFRASSLDRLLNCFGSHALLERLAELTSEDVAMFGPSGDMMTWRGNWIHYDSALRLVIDHGAAGEPEYPHLPADWKPTVWDSRQSEWYVSNVLLLTPSDHALYVETRITMEFPRFFLTGQIDMHSIDATEEEFTINDDKTGPHVVAHAEENWQLLAYTTLLKHAFPKLKRGKIRILQKDAPDQITEADVDQTDGLADFIESKINEALDKSMELNSGYKQCRLCDGVLALCPAIVKEIEAMKVLLTKENLDQLQAVPDLAKLAEICQRGRAIKGPIDKLLTTLKARLIGADSVILKDGTIVKVAEELGNREIKHVKAAFTVAAAKITEDLAWDTMQISLTKLEDQLVAAGMQRASKNPEVDTAQKWIKTNFAHLVFRPKQQTLTWL